MVWTFEDKPITTSNMSVWVLEDQSDGQLINAWSLDCRMTRTLARGGSNEEWVACHAGDVGVGHKRIINVVLPTEIAAAAAAAAAKRGNEGVAMTAIRLNVYVALSRRHLVIPGANPSPPWSTLAG